MLARTTASGTLMRNKLEPVSDPDPAAACRAEGPAFQRRHPEAAALIPGINHFLAALRSGMESRDI